MCIIVVITIYIVSLYTCVVTCTAVLLYMYIVQQYRVAATL